ncbi:MAG: DUF3039 domain-containing protein [Micrococcales bacterium]|nr:DUF3039 domain-containing protein [Micrococcales bacterium]
MTDLPSPPLPPVAPQRPDGPASAGKTQLLERQETATEAGDHERFAHYVRKDKIVGSAVSGKPVVALCGKVWVPKRDPSRYPVCPVCKEIFQALGPSGHGDSPDQ